MLSGLFVEHRQILNYGFAAAGARSASLAVAIGDGVAGIATAGAAPSTGTEARLPISTPSKNKSTQSKSRQSPAIVIIRAVSDKVYCICYLFSRLRNHDGELSRHEDLDHAAPLTHQLR
jgi:hypothetical protein